MDSKVGISEGVALAVAAVPPTDSLAVSVPVAAAGPELAAGGTDGAEPLDGPVQGTDAMGTTVEDVDDPEQRIQLFMANHRSYLPLTESNHVVAVATLDSKLNEVLKADEAGKLASLETSCNEYLIGFAVVVGGLVKARCCRLPAYVQLVAQRGVDSPRDRAK